MTKKFAITAPQAPQHLPHTPALAQDMEHFITGAEPLTTMTVQLPMRLKRALKRQALERDTSVKTLLMEILETHFAHTP